MQFLVKEEKPYSDVFIISYLLIYSMQQSPS